MDKLKLKSMDFLNENLDIISTYFPSAITEIKDSTGGVKKGINFELLKQELSPIISDENECYEFRWIGKTKAIAESIKPTRKTLRPVIEQSRDWDITENLYFEGDNLDILKLMQKSYKSKVKMIYIDPPYNNGNTYIYNDDYSIKRYQSISERRNKLSNQIFSQDRKFHSGWCNMIYPRLKIARTLLTDDGVIFISIDDNELDNLKKICNEIFGENNFVTIIGIEITKTQGMKVKAAKEGSIVKNLEYVLCYAKKTTNKKIVKNILFDKNEGYDTHFSYYIEKNGENISIRKLVNELQCTKEIYDEFKKHSLTSKTGKISLKSIEKAISISKKIRKFIYFDIADNIYQSMPCNIKLSPIIQKKLDDKKIVKYKNYLIRKTDSGKIRQFSPLSETLNHNDEYKSEYGRVTIRGNMWKGFYSDMMNVAKEGDVEYKNGKKPVRMIYQLAKWIGVEDGDIVMDFFSGSATTAHAVMELNLEDFGHRKFIMVQINEDLDQLLKTAVGETKKNIKKAIDLLDNVNRPHYLSELGKERIIRAGKKIIERMEEKNLRNKRHRIDTGFRVFRLDSSNMADEYYSENNKVNKINSNINHLIHPHLKQGRSEQDLLYNIFLDLGLPLTVNPKKEEIHNVNIYSVSNNVRYEFHTTLVVCFATRLSIDVINKIAVRKPEYAVFRDMAFPGQLGKSDMNDIFSSVSPSTNIFFI